MARLDTGWHANPKVLKLGWAAMGLHAWSISYCDATRSDGFIPEGAWPSLPGGKAAVSALRGAEIWTPVEGGYMLHDYLDYNRSRARIAELGAIRAAAAAAKSEQIAEQNGSNLLSKPPPNGEQFATPGPGPGLTPGLSVSLSPEESLRVRGLGEGSQRGTTPERQAVALMAQAAAMATRTDDDDDKNFPDEVRERMARRPLT